MFCYPMEAITLVWFRSLNQSAPMTSSNVVIARDSPSLLSLHSSFCAIHLWAVTCRRLAVWPPLFSLFIIISVCFVTPLEYVYRKLKPVKSHVAATYIKITSVIIRIGIPHQQSVISFNWFANKLTRECCISSRVLVLNRVRNSGWKENFRLLWPIFWGWPPE